MNNASQKLQAMKIAFQAGLVTAGEQLGELAQFTDTFTFSPDAIQLLPFESQSAFEPTEGDVWRLEIMDHLQCVGYASLSFPPGSALSLVSIILNQAIVSEAEQVDVLQEVTNILINACLAPLAPALHMRLAGGLPSSDLSLIKPGSQVLRLHALLSAENAAVRGELSLLIRVPSPFGTWYIMEDRDLRRD